MSPQRFNGLMIDCSRLMEPHEYYFRLLDFMGEWGMNVLLFHFTDDHGCGVELPGFEHLAMPNAFTTKELGELAAHAAARGIDLIPELETFGHTRYLTDRPEFGHLYAGNKTQDLTFNAVDPLNPQSFRLMARLMQAVVSVFPSPCLHIGCDEVDIRALCESHMVDEDSVWCQYVNQIIGEAVRLGRVPMMWADHPTKNERIAGRLRKDVILVDWRYGAEVTPDVVPRLRQAGFDAVLCAPSIARWGISFFPSRSCFENTTRMCRFAAESGAAGVINTIWIPFRYFQATLYYAAAYSARCAAAGGRVSLPEFQREFGEKLFGLKNDPHLTTFLTHWPDVEFAHAWAVKLAAKTLQFDARERDELERMIGHASAVVAAAARVFPRQNAAVFAAMRLSAEAAWVCAEYSLLATAATPPAKPRITAYNKRLAKVRAEASAEWDRTRFPDDPQKYEPKFHAYSCHALHLLECCLPLDCPGQSQPRP